MTLFTPLSLQGGQKVFAVGDIHGCYEELEELLELLVSKGGLSKEDSIVFLGDYVDRGPFSRKVITRLIQIKKEYPNSFFLRGNHEDMILDFLGYGGNYGPFCIVNGADKFFSDYGLEDFYIWNGNDQVSIKYPLTQEEIVESIPKSHIKFLLETEHGLLSDEFIFVHAGIDPWESLEKQTSEELLWIREMFLCWPHNEKQIVVHGHTPSSNPYYDDHKRVINVDTGCFKGGMLTAVELRSKEFFSVNSRQPDNW